MLNYKSKAKLIEEVIRSIYKSVEIYLHPPKFIGKEIEYVTKTIQSTFVSSVGEFVNEFEKNIASYTGCKKAIAIVNGTSALHLCLKLMNVNQNDYVITQPLSFIATTNPISYIGADPIFIDIDSKTMGLCPNSLELFLEKNTEIKGDNCFLKKDKRRISACIPMHTFGIPSKIDKIVEICKRFKIKVIEDCAESLGSFFNGRHTGTFGDIGFFSFNGNKVITTGGGGMIITNNEKIAKLAKHLSTQAKVKHPWKFIHDGVGYNYRMPNLNAALGCAQFENLDLILNKKRIIHETYINLFSRTEVDFFECPNNVKSNHWLNFIICESLKERDFILEYLNNRKIQVRPAWELINSLDMYKKTKNYGIKNSQFFYERIINLPSGLV